MEDDVREVMTQLVAIIDEELLPNAAGIAIQDFGRLNSTLVDARSLLLEKT